MRDAVSVSRMAVCYTRGNYIIPADIDKSLHDAAAGKIREYRAGYNNCPSNSISFMPAVATTSGRLHCELVRNFYFFFSNILFFLF